ADYLVQAGSLDEASTLYESASRAQGGGFRALLGIAEVRRAQGRFDAAIEARRLAWGAVDPAMEEPTRLMKILSNAKGAAGLERIEFETARLQLESLRERARHGAYVSPTDMGRVSARLGDSTSALHYLTLALAERS